LIYGRVEIRRMENTESKGACKIYFPKLDIFSCYRISLGNKKPAKPFGLRVLDFWWGGVY
jgi:hypothetical protein